MRMMKVEALSCPTIVCLSHSHRTTPSTSFPFCTTASCASLSTHKSRRVLSLSAVTLSFSTLLLSTSNYGAYPQVPNFLELPNSGGVKALDLRIGDGETPLDGDLVAIHYYGRLAAKQGWRFDSTYDHKDETGEPIPFSFILGSGKVISGIETAVRSMKVGALRRVIIPPSQGYQKFRIHPKNPCHLITSTGKGFLLPFSTQPVLQMEKVQHWGHSYLILNWSA